jgi:hypothetical protein
MGSQLDPLPLSRVGSRERLPSPNFPQLHFGEPSSGFTPGLGSASYYLKHTMEVSHKPTFVMVRRDPISNTIEKKVKEDSMEAQLWTQSL